MNGSRAGKSALRIHLCSAVLALCAALPAAVAADGSQAAAIARRSFESTEAVGIARRSLPASRSRRPAAAAVDRGSIAAPPRRPAPPAVMPLDEVRVERTARYRRLIERHSRRHRIDADLVQAIVYTESGGDRQAASPKGARGLMQLMPATARQLGVEDPENPEQAVDGGVRYLRHLLDRFGSTELVLWAYNAGPGAVEAKRLPAETADYVPRVLAVRGALKARQVREAGSP